MKFLYKGEAVDGEELKDPPGNEIIAYQISGRMVLPGEVEPVPKKTSKKPSTKDGDETPAKNPVDKVEPEVPF